MRGMNFWTGIMHNNLKIEDSQGRDFFTQIERKKVGSQSQVVVLILI